MVFLHLCTETFNKKIVDKVGKAKSPTNQEVIQNISQLKLGFCNEVKIQRCQIIGPGTGQLDLLFDKLNFGFGISFEKLTPLSVSVINLFAKDPILQKNGKCYPFWRHHENVLVKLDKNVFFDPPKENILKVFFQFLSKNGLDRYENIFIDNARYKHFSVLTGLPILRNSTMWFFPKKITIKELTNIILATGDLPKTRAEACRLYKGLKLNGPKITNMERN